MIDTMLAHSYPCMPASTTHPFTHSPRWRFILGVGLGGDYPLAAVLVSEYAPIRWRGTMLALVFANQGLGYIGACITSLVVINVMDRQIEQVCKHGGTSGR